VNECMCCVVFTEGAAGAGYSSDASPAIQDRRDSKSSRSPGPAPPDEAL